MLKKFTSLFPLTLILTLALMAGCAAKSHLATPEDVLKEIASSRWEVDIDASMQVDSFVRDLVESMGKEEFVQKSGQFGFAINLEPQRFIWHESREVLLERVPFAVAPETPEDKAAWESGIRQVRLALDGYKHDCLLRYEDNGKISIFADDKLVGVFSRLKE